MPALLWQHSIPCLLGESSSSSSPARIRSMASSQSLPPLPEHRVVLGCGSVGVDFLAAVASYPKPDDKIRSTSLKVQGGGNAGNALTCAARLGLKPRLISKVADDAQGRDILQELEADGVDTSFIVVSREGNSPFTYIIVDNEKKTRTCVHSPGHPRMVPADLSQSSLVSALQGARLAYFDGRLHETALLVAQEATRRDIPILMDAERIREGLDSILGLANYAVCAAQFPQEWTQAPTLASSLVSMMLKLPKLKFAIVTLGDEGCVMLERSSITSGHQADEVDVDNLLETLKQQRDDGTTVPTCLTSSETKLRADGIGMISGRLLLGTAEKIPWSELVDTTGAGDAFVGAILYGEPFIIFPGSLWWILLLNELTRGQ